MAHEAEEDIMVTDDMKLVSIAGDREAEEEEEIEWAAEKTQGEVGGYVVAAQRGRGRVTEVMMLSAEMTDDALQCYGRVVDKQELVDVAGFHAGAPFDAMASTIEGAIKQDDEDVEIVLVEGEGDSGLLQMQINEQLKRYAITYNIPLERIEVTKEILLERQVSEMQAVIDQLRASAVATDTVVANKDREQLEELREVVRDLIIKQDTDKETIAAQAQEIEELRARLAEDEEKVEGDAGSEVVILSKLMCRQTLKGHSELISSVAMSVDGRIAVSGSRDQSIRVWDVEKGKCLSAMEKAHPQRLWNEGGVKFVLLTSQLNAISCGGDGSVKSWSFGGRNLKLIWEKKVAKLYRLCLSDDETVIAGAAEYDKHCFVLNRVDGTLIAKIATGSSGLFGVCFAGSWLLCAGKEKTVDVIDVSKKRQLTGPTSWVLSIAYCASLDLVAASTGAADKSIHIWQFTGSNPVARLFGHTAAVSSILFHPINPSILVSCADDRSIRMWSVSNSTCLCSVDEAHSDCINHLSLSSDGAMLLSASGDESVKKWSFE